MNIKKIFFYMAVLSLIPIFSGCFEFKTNIGGNIVPQVEIQKMYVTNGVFTIDAATKYYKEDIEQVSYKIYIDNGGVLIPEEIVAEGAAEAEDGKFDSSYEYMSIKTSSKNLSAGRYLLLLKINGSTLSTPYDIIIDKSGNVIEDRIYVTSVSGTTFYCRGSVLTQNRYSYVVYKIKSSIEKTVIKEGVVFPVKDYSDYSLNADLGTNVTSGTYKIQFYKESLSEINGNYDGYTCINDPDRTFKPE